MSFVVHDIAKLFRSVVILHIMWPRESTRDWEVLFHGWVNPELVETVGALGLAIAHVVSAELHTVLIHLSTSGKPFDPVFILSRSVSNIICSVIFGSRFDYDDERLLTIIHFINDNFKIMSSPWGEVITLRSTRWGHGSTGPKNAPGGRRRRIATSSRPS